jgi:hypothetical protein
VSSPAAREHPDARFGSPIDVETRLFGELPDDTWVYPGHGNRHDDRHRAAAPGGMARARLVTPTLSRTRRTGAANPDQRAADLLVSAGRGHVTPTLICHADAPARASWRGIDGTAAPVHAHMLQW